MIILDGREYGTADEIAEALGPGIASARGREWAPATVEEIKAEIHRINDLARRDRRHEVGVDQATL